MINYYKYIADFYDRRWKRYTERSIEKVFQYLPNSLENKIILDFGCGTGELIKKLFEVNPSLGHVVGYDPSEEMLQQAKDKIDQFPDHIRKKIDFQDHKIFETEFDIIVSTSVLHYLPHPHEEFLNFRKLLRKGGILILLDYSKKGFLAKHFEWIIKSIDVQHQKVYYPHQIREMVLSAGFTMERNEELNLTPLWKGYILKAFP